MTRIRILEPDDMTAEQREIYERFAAEGKPHAGPYWAYIRHPALMQLCSDVGEWFRDSNLSGRERQLAVLTVIRHWDANYPWAVQVRNSLAAGVTQAEADAINNRRDPGLTDPREQMAHEVALQLTAKHRLTEATYNRAIELFGEEDFVALASVIGFFGMVCTTANSIDATPPDAAPDRLV
jgi:4-carboxymuconolactone decarboxylase